MKVLELFSGTESFSKVARERGHECFTVDNNPKFEPNLCIDIMDLTHDMIQFTPDIIWASPPCIEYSHAKRGKIRNLELADSFVLKTIKIIEELKPKFWVIENPQTGLLKKRTFMKDLNYADASYCMYGRRYRKQTRFWNNFNLKLKICNKKCGSFFNGRHIDSIGNDRERYTSKRYKKLEKYAVPRKLCLEIIKACEKGV